MMKVWTRLKALAMVILKNMIDLIVVDYCCGNVGERVDDNEDVVDETETAVPDNSSSVETVDSVERSDTGELS